MPVYSENFHRDPSERGDLYGSGYGQSSYSPSTRQNVTRPRESYEEWARSIQQQQLKSPRTPTSPSRNLNNSLALNTVASPRDMKYEDWIDKLNSPQSQASTLSPRKWAPSNDTRIAPMLKAAPVNTVPMTRAAPVPVTASYVPTYAQPQSFSERQVRDVTEVKVVLDGVPVRRDVPMRQTAVRAAPPPPAVRAAPPAVRAAPPVSSPSGASLAKTIKVDAVTRQDIVMKGTDSDYLRKENQELREKLGKLQLEKANKPVEVVEKEKVVEKEIEKIVVVEKEVEKIVVVEKEVEKVMPNLENEKRLDELITQLEKALPVLEMMTARAKKKSEETKEIYLDRVVEVEKKVDRPTMYVERVETRTRQAPPSINENSIFTSPNKDRNGPVVREAPAPPAPFLNAPQQPEVPPEIVGLGMRLGRRTSGVTDPTIIEEVVVGSAAALGGEVKRGDELLAIDGTLVRGLDLRAVANLSRGPAGSSSTVRCRRPQGGEYEARVHRRRAVPTASVAALSASSDWDRPLRASFSGTPTRSSMGGGGGSLYRSLDTSRAVAESVPPLYRSLTSEASPSRVLSENYHRPTPSPSAGPSLRNSMDERYLAQGRSSMDEGAIRAC